MAVLGAGLLAMALAAAGSVDVAAQDAATLNAVLVTAGGRSEPVGQTPISLKLHDRLSIERQGLERIDDIAGQTPGLTFTRTAYGATTQIAIRGLVSKLGASTTGIYLDDAPIQVRSLGFTAANPFPSLFDLERVEVLRGPQGTLYGAGAEGGAIRFITPDADLARAGGRLMLEGAHLDGGGWSHAAGAAAGAPIIQDKAAFRIAVWARTDGGYIDRVDRESGRLLERNANRQDSQMGRVAFAFALSPRLTISPKLEFQQRRQKDSNAYWERFSDPGAGRFASGFRAAQPDRDRWVLPSVKIAFQGEGALLTVTSAYLHRTDISVVDYSTLIPSSFGPPVVRGLPGYLAYADMANKQTSVSHELRLQSTTPGARIEWLIGGYYGSARQRAIEALSDPQGDALAFAIAGVPLARVTGAPLIDNRYSFLLDDRSRDRQAALFGDVRIHIDPRLTLTGGVRAASSRFLFAGMQSGPYAGGVGGGSGIQREHPVTPRVGINLQADPKTLLYVSAAKGYRIGGVNNPAPAGRCAADLAALGVAGTPEAYRSDHVWSYEAGAKTSLLDDRLSLQSSAYWIDWSRIQQSVGLPGCGFQYTANLGSATSKGFDLALQAHPAPGLSVSLSLAYVDARFDDTVHGGVISAATGQRAVIVSAGDRLGVRPWTAAVSAEYRFQAGQGLPAYLRADYEYLGPQAVPAPLNDPATVSYDPGLPGAGAAHGLSARAGAWLGDVELVVFCDNLLNAAPRLLRAHDSKASPLYAGVTTPPRTLGLTARYAF